MALSTSDCAPCRLAADGALSKMQGLGLKVPIILDMVRFIVARHRAFRQKIHGQPKHDEPLLAALRATDRAGSMASSVTTSTEACVQKKLEIIRSRAFCNAVRIADRTSCYVVAEIIRPVVAPGGLYSATGAVAEVLPALLFNLVIMRAYVNDGARFAFLGLQDYRRFDDVAFVTQIERYMTLQGKDVMYDMSNPAYNVGTFHTHATSEQAAKKGVKGNKKRYAAACFKTLSGVVEAVAAAMLHEPSAGKTFELLTRPVASGGLGIFNFPAYNITLDLGYYSRALCDEDTFDYIGPGAIPGAHYLMGEAFRYTLTPCPAAPAAGTLVCPRGCRSAMGVVAGEKKKRGAAPSPAKGARAAGEPIKEEGGSPVAGAALAAKKRRKPTPRKELLMKTESPPGAASAGECAPERWHTTKEMAHRWIRQGCIISSLRAGAAGEGAALKR